MADSATAAPPKKKLLFKRTVARRKDLEDGAPKPKRDDDDDGVDLFSRVGHELPGVLAEQESRVKSSGKRSSTSTGVESDLDGEDVKRRRLSMDSDEERPNGGTPRQRSSLNRGSITGSASKRKPRSCAQPDEHDDISARRKGNGKEIARDSPMKAKSRPITPPATITLDDDADPKVLSTPQPPRSGALSSRRTRSQRLLSPHEDEPLPISFGDIQPAVEKPRDDEDDDLQIVEPPQEEEESEDELAEWVERARAKRAAEREREEKVKLERASQATPSQEAGPTMGHSSFDQGSGYNNDSQGSGPDMDNPIIQIMVTSELPGMKQKVMKRRIHQTLRLIKVNFLLYQNPPIPTSMADHYHLTWKGNKIYDTTTAADLGIHVEKGWRADEAAVIDGAQFAHHSEGNGFHKNTLHLELWTEELYQDYLKKKERARQRLLGRSADEDDEYGDKMPGSGYQDSDDSDDDGEVEEEATTRIILKAAKDYEPFRFKVHAHTTIDEMIAKFREARKVPEDKEISLFFDGEKLDDDMAVRDTELEDMDSIEVHIK